MPEEDDHDEISRLLRLKRFEQPAPEYFDEFLREFQRRQRAQLLREPAWRIAWDRLVAFFAQLASRGSFGYGLASAAVLLVAAVVSFEILHSHPQEIAVGREVASVQPARFGLNSQIHLPDMTAGFRRLAHPATTLQPRYVMDTRPVSYEPSSSF